MGKRTLLHQTFPHLLFAFLLAYLPIAAVLILPNTFPFAGLLLSGLAIIAGLALPVLYLYGRIREPLRLLHTGASAFADGNLDHRIQISDPSEMALLAETMNGMGEELTSRLRSISSRRNELEAILAGMVEGVLLIGEGGRIRKINNAACRLFSVSADEATGRQLLEAVRNSELYDFYIRTRKAGSKTEGGVHVYAGESRYLQAHGSLLSEGITGGGSSEAEGDGSETAEGGPGTPGRSAGQKTTDAGDVLIVLNDITRIKRLETVRKEFVANVSHELKTPITSILGFVETLQDGAVEERESAHQFLEIIASHTRRLNTIIDDLLQLARLEQTEEQVPMEQLDTVELLERSVTTHRYAAKTKEIAVLTRIPAPIPPLRGNRTLLERAISNLLDNAIKYSPLKTTVTVEAETRHAVDGTDRLVLRVTDQGPGIAPLEQSRIFERFYRVDKNRSRELGGTGLGLAIVKHVARVHGGSVDLESERGIGSSFILEFPLPQGAGNGPGLDKSEQQLHRPDEGAEDSTEHVNPF